jgi:streptogramin lyase
LSGPGNLCFGSDGDLYVTDGSGVKKYNGTTGAYLGDFAAGFSGATDIVFDAHGNAYVADDAANTVSKFSSNGTLLQTFTAGISTPEGLAFAANGNLLVANTYSGAYRDTVTSINTTTGAYSTFATGLGEPVGITAGPDGRYYVGNYTYSYSYGGQSPPDTIQVIGANGGVAQTWNSGSNLDGTSYLAFSAGDLFVTSYYNNQVVAFDGTTGAYISSFAGPSGTEGIAVQPSAVPEVSSLVTALLGLGLASAGLLIRRRI